MPQVDFLCSGHGFVKCVTTIRVLALSVREELGELWEHLVYGIG